MDSEVRTLLRAELEKFDGLGDGRDPLTAQERGIAFEKWLVTLMRSKDPKQDLHPRLSFRPKGEEIDGSFICDSRIFLLEAKWHQRPLAASAVYAFKGKVDGKLAGTVGVFVSMTGYSEAVVDALRIGKELNVLLFDRADVEAAVDDGFKKVLRVKMRAAAELGEVKYPYIRDVERRQSHQVIVLTPDTTDEALLRILLERVSSTRRLARYEVRSAGSNDALKDTIKMLLKGTRGRLVVLAHDHQLVSAETSDMSPEETLLPVQPNNRISFVGLDIGVREWLLEPSAADRTGDLTTRAQNVEVGYLEQIPSFRKLLGALAH